MSRRLRALVTREAIRPERLADSVAVVVDVFLATTTLLTILENGARRVVPVRTLAEADAARTRLDPGRVLRGGELMAEPVEGFDCGPFPEEYPPERVRGRDVIYLSTNGTAAVLGSTAASRTLVASLRNAPAVAEHLRALRPESVHVVCAGSLGRLALDDLVGAGCVVSALLSGADAGGPDPEVGGPGGWLLDDAAWVARELVERRGGRVRAILRHSKAGRWFHENDRLDAFDFVTDVGASELVAELRDGELVRMEKG